MDKCFVIERVSSGGGKYKMEFFGDRPFLDARAAEARAAKMAQTKPRQDCRISVRAVAFEPR